MKKYLLAVIAIFFIVSPTFAQDMSTNIVPSQGFSAGSLMRGVLGMLVLLIISILLSKNRKAINWRTVGFGLAAQLLLAIGVLKVPFIQAI